MSIDEGISAPIAVMVSGRGSNLKAILDAQQQGICPVDVRLVISDKPDAAGLDIARDAGVSKVLYINPKKYNDRAEFDAVCAVHIKELKCEWIALAGYMRILSASFVETFPNRIVNIHPALLPAFPGAHSVEDALHYGVKYTGCTVHLVNEVLDGGPILAQAIAPLLDHDTIESLHTRIHTEEHLLYPATLARMIREGFTLDGRKIIWG